MRRRTRLQVLGKMHAIERRIVQWAHSRSVSKRPCCAKTKAMSDVSPTLSEQFDTGVVNVMSPLPSFVMAKSLSKDCTKMTKDKDDAQKEVDDERNQLIVGMRGAEPSKGTCLDKVMSNVLTPPKTSAHSTNFEMSENASTSVALV